MSESHSKGEQRHRPLVSAGTGSESAMTRSGYGLQFKPYVYAGGDKEPAAVIAARERWRAQEAEIERIRAQAAAEACDE